MKGNDRSQRAAALDVRSNFNVQRGSCNLGQLISVHLQLKSGTSLLDIGCGTGQVLLTYAAGVPAPLCLVAIDISAESLARLRSAASMLGVQIGAHNLDMDDLIDPDVHPAFENFTHISAVYSLYYSKHPVELVRALSKRLRKSGTFLIVAPAPGNNTGWFHFLRTAGAEVPEWIGNLGQSFLPSLVKPVVEELYRDVSYLVATNTVTFRAPEQLKEYWLSNIYFEPGASDVVCKAIDKYFAKTNVFVIDKRIGFLIGRHVQ